MSGLAGLIASALPLLVMTATAVVLAVLVARALRDETVVEGIRVEVQRLGETHRAVGEARAQASRGRLRP